MYMRNVGVPRADSWEWGGFRGWLGDLATLLTYSLFKYPIFGPGSPDGNEEATIYKKVAMVENFFDIIYNVHVEMDGRGGKHAGQKRTYKAIAETYAFLPREAVTKFLMQCADCQKRMHAATTSAAPPAEPAGGSNGTPSPAPSDTSTATTRLRDNESSACAVSVSDPPQIDFSLPITTTYLKHMRSLGYSEEDALNPEAGNTECSSSSVDSESTGEDEELLPTVQDTPLADSFSPAPKIPKMHSSVADAVNGSHLTSEHSYDKPVAAAKSEVVTPWQASPAPVNMSKNGDSRDQIADVRSLQDHTYDESMNQCNGRFTRESTATPQDLSSGIKDDDDDDEDENDDRLDSHKYDPERLKAFNMFVRLFVDENLDRMVPISKQPREKIQAIIDSCNRQFPEFAERARKRIRTYLKSCRRTKRTRDHNGWDLVRPTLPHLTSAMAEQILASACENESNNAKRMRLGLEPISATGQHLQGVDKENSGERGRAEPFECGTRLQSPARPTSTGTLPLPQSSPQLNGALMSAAAATPAFRTSALVTSQPAPTDAPPTNGPTDLTVKKSNSGATKCNLNPSEVLAVKQLIAGYRESAAFLIRSADELEQLLLQQN
uniref:Nucleolar protein 4 helical domain-containing protein n=1 Tax=Strigamia maritima TaxID=126957 RepID=T1J728_STRMM